LDFLEILDILAFLPNLLALLQKIVSTADGLHFRNYCFGRKLLSLA
jgi:hypothetical protein